jgi:hypothetical protein
MMKLLLCVAMVSSLGGPHSIDLLHVHFKAMIRPDPDGIHWTIAEVEAHRVGDNKSPANGKVRGCSAAPQGGA